MVVGCRMTTPVFDVVLEDLRNAWQQVDPSTIAPEWWEALLGHPPIDPHNPGDLVLAVVALVDLQNKLAQHDA